VGEDLFKLTEQREEIMDYKQMAEISYAVFKTDQKSKMLGKTWGLKFQTREEILKGVEDFFQLPFMKGNDGFFTSIQKEVLIAILLELRNIYGADWHPMIMAEYLNKDSDQLYLIMKRTNPYMAESLKSGITTITIMDRMSEIGRFVKEFARLWEADFLNQIANEGMSSETSPIRKRL